MYIYIYIYIYIYRHIFCLCEVHDNSTCDMVKISNFNSKNHE